MDEDHRERRGERPGRDPRNWKPAVPAQVRQASAETSEDENRMILFLEGVSLSSRGNEVAHPVIPRSEATRDPFQSRTEASKGSLAALG